MTITWRRLPWALACLLLFIILMQLRSSSAHAMPGLMTGTIPNDSSDHWLMVARPGSNGMDAREQQVAGYVADSQNSFTVTIRDACDTANDEGTGNNATDYYFYPVANAVIRSGTGTVENPGTGTFIAKCTAGSSITVEVSLYTGPFNGFSGYQTTVVNTSAFGPVTLKQLTLLARTRSGSNSYYENRFRYESSNAFFGYSVSSGFTGVAYRVNASGWGYSVNIAFAQKCSTPAINSTGTVRFRDTDHQNANSSSSPFWQNNTQPMRFVMHRYDRFTQAYRGTVSSTDNPSGILRGGQIVDDPTSPTFDFNSDYVYRIEVTNINRVNTLQISVPFDQVDAVDICAPPPPPPDPGRCPEQAGFFPTSYWKQATNVQRPLPGNTGNDGGYYATDVYTREYINDQISNPTALSNHGVTLSARGNTISNVEADYQPLVDQLPYDTHSVTGTAQFPYRERYKRLINVTATWTRTVQAAYTTVDYQWSYSSPGGSWVNTGNCYYADQHWTTSVPKGYSVLSSRPVVDGKGNVVGTEYLVGIQTCLYSQTTYHPPVTQTETTTAYSAPPPPSRGVYWNIAWNLDGASASYAPETQTQEQGTAVITYPTLGDCLFRRMTNVMNSTIVGVAPVLEDPSTVTYTTTMQTTFAPTDSSRTQIRAQNRANSLNYSTNYYIRNAATGVTRSLTDYILPGGSFRPASGTHSAPLSGTFGFGSINSTSVDSFRVSRGGAGAPAGQAISRDDTFCSTITSSPRVVLIDSSGTIRRVENASGTTATGLCSQPVVDAPHFRIFNGDGVATGMPIINSNEVCGAGNINASVRGSRSGRGAFYGSTTQVAGRAAGIVSIGTSSRFPSVAVDNRLTFPSFRLSGDCMVNYFSRPRVAERTNLPMSLNSADYIGTSSYQLAGGATLPSGELRQGARLALYVNGNATISGNITYQNSSVGYSTIESMPHLMIVVNGNLSIAPGVTRVDATIMASGRVLTCSTGTWDGCRGGASSPLVINGIVTANSIRPFRLIGTASLGAPTETPGSSTLGDAFVISPESILSLPPMPTQGGITNLDSITELPPLF